MIKKRHIILILILALSLTACDLIPPPPSAPPPANSTPTAEVVGETARVVRVIDGDTIDVDLDGQRYRVRYIGINTPERDEACYQDATDANVDWVAGQTVTLVKDVSETDPYDRLLRYVYVGDTFVNEALVRDGYAEAVQYPPDTSNADLFNRLEREARSAGRGCHPTGVFD
ncbi:thermonuclease family protein [Chloroflexota bacterium]